MALGRLRKADMAFNARTAKFNYGDGKAIAAPRRVQITQFFIISTIVVSKHNCHL